MPMNRRKTVCEEEPRPFHGAPPQAATSPRRPSVSAMVTPHGSGQERVSDAGRTAAVGRVERHAERIPTRGTATERPPALPRRIAADPDRARPGPSRRSPAGCGRSSSRPAAGSSSSVWLKPTSPRTVADEAAERDAVIGVAVDRAAPCVDAPRTEREPHAAPGDVGRRPEEGRAPIRSPAPPRGRRRSTRWAGCRTAASGASSVSPRVFVAKRAPLRAGSYSRSWVVGLTKSAPVIASSTAPFTPEPAPPVAPAARRVARVQRRRVGREREQATPRCRPAGRARRRRSGSRSARRSSAP